MYIFSFEKLERNPKKVIFAEGEQPDIIRVAAMWRDHGYGKPVLVGKKERVLENMKEANVDPKGIEIYNADQRIKAALANQESGSDTAERRTRAAVAAAESLGQQAAAALNGLNATSQLVESVG